MNRSQLLRLQRIEIDGLFDVYNHCIDLHLDDRITLIHGQNGVGKTTILRMIYALLGKNLAYFRRVPFKRFSLDFQDGSTLEIERESGNESRIFSIRLRGGGGVNESFKLNVKSEAKSLARQIDYLRPLHEGNVTRWIDVRDREELTESIVLFRYGEKSNVEGREDSPSWFDFFLENANAYLIDAQRLIRARSEIGNEDTVVQMAAVVQAMVGKRLKYADLIAEMPTAPPLSDVF